MKACVVYDSFFGNTEKIAKAIGSILEKGYQVKTVSIDQLAHVDLNEMRLLVVGSPTRAFEPTKAISGLLKNLKPAAYPDLRVACFDTRMDVKKVDNKILNFFVKFRGYALDTMEKQVKKNGFLLEQSGIGFFVEDSEGPLAAGEIEKAEQWSLELMERNQL